MTTIKVSFEIDVNIRPDVIEAILAQMPGLKIETVEAIEADERDLVNIAEVDGDFIVETRN